MASRAGSELSQVGPDELSDLFARCLISMLQCLKLCRNLMVAFHALIERHPQLLQDVLVAVPPSVSFRMEVPTGWEQACFSPRHYSPDAQGRPSVREVARSVSPTEPADEVPVPVVERDRPEERDAERSPSVLPETARASPEGEHRQRRRKRRRDRPEGQESSHREKKEKKERKEKEKKRRREDSPQQERKSAKSGEAPAKAGEVPKERGAVKSQPVVKAPPVAPPPPKAFPYGRTAGGLPRMLLWNVKEIPSGYFARAKAAPAEGDPVKTGVIPWSSR